MGGWHYHITPIMISAQSFISFRLESGVGTRTENIRRSEVFILRVYLPTTWEDGIITSPPLRYSARTLDTFHFSGVRGGDSHTRKLEFRKGREAFHIFHLTTLRIPYSKINRIKHNLQTSQAPLLLILFSPNARGKRKGIDSFISRPQ